MWLQSSIAQWRWWPTGWRTKGAVFPAFGKEEACYHPSTRSYHWGRWIWTWESPLFDFDRLPEGAEAVVNGIACRVRHWKFPFWGW